MEASRHELRLAFYRHWHAYNNANPKTPSHWMVLFYAVECGLKLFVMRNNPKMKSTADLDEELRSHCINLLLKKAGYGSPGVKSVKYGPDRTSMWAESAEIHLLWRYGIDADEAGQAAAVGRLSEIAEWLEAEAV